MNLINWPEKKYNRWNSCLGHCLYHCGQSGFFILLDQPGGLEAIHVNADSCI